MSRKVVHYVLGTVTVLLFLGMARHAAPLDPGIPEIQFCFSDACFRAVLAQWQAGGVERFKDHFLIDFPFLASYGCLGYVLAGRVFTGPGWAPSAKRFLAWALPSAALMDAVENALHLVFVHAARTLPEALYVLAGVTASIKWVLIAVFAIAVGYALIGNWRRTRT